MFWKLRAQKKLQTVSRQEQRRYIHSKKVLVVGPQSSHPSEDLVLEPTSKRYNNLNLGWLLALGPRTNKIWLRTNERLFPGTKGQQPRFNPYFAYISWTEVRGLSPWSEK